jgi:hypothetical protein
MNHHSFILQPNSWIGEGKIILNMVEEDLGFFTRWSVSDSDAGGKIECLQEVQVKGLSEVMLNQFVFYDMTPNSFVVELENQALGRVVGKGVINDQVIAWEFRVTELGFEGFEFYERQSDNSYTMRAEYASSDQFRTLIQGRVWLPSHLQKGKQ